MHLKKNWFCWTFFLWAIFCKYNFFQKQKFKVPFPRLYKINIFKVFLNCYGEYWPWFKQKIKTLYEKNRVDPYPYPPPQSKVKVSRHGTGTDKWPFRNSFTSQFPLESISNILSIYRLPKSSGPPFFCGFFKICSGLFAFHLAFSSVFICNGFYMMERCSYQR